MVYWQLLEHARAYYAVDNLQAAMVNLVLTQIRAEMGKLDLDQTFTTRQEVNEALLLAQARAAAAQQMSNAPGGSVLMVDPQSPASLLTALRNLQVGGAS